MDTFRFVWRALRAQIPMCWQRMGRCASKHNWPITIYLTASAWFMNCWLLVGRQWRNRRQRPLYVLDICKWHSLIAQCTQKATFRCFEWSFFIIYITDILLLSPHVAMWRPVHLPTSGHTCISFGSLPRSFRIGPSPNVRRGLNRTATDCAHSKTFSDAHNCIYLPYSPAYKAHAPISGCA